MVEFLDTQVAEDALVTSPQIIQGQPGVRWPFHFRFDSLRAVLRPLRHFGLRRYCPFCERRLRTFLPGGVVSRPEARCPLCGSLERHRLIWYFFRHKTGLFDGRPRRLLHVAPEPAFIPKLKAIPGLDYLSADLDSPYAMVRMDLTDIRYPEGHFDVIHCSHVLEHVADDRKAMRELCRVLAGGGWATIQVPVTARQTVEDPSIQDPAERERRFGQADHVRAYGPDVLDRLRDAGFSVMVCSAADIVGERNLARFGVAGEQIFYCRKPPTDGASGSANG